MPSRAITQEYLLKASESPRVALDSQPIDPSCGWSAEREIKTRARTKVFRVGAIILFVVVFGGIALSTLAGDVEVGTPVIGLQGAAIGYQDDFTAGHRGSRSRSSNRQTRRPPLPTAMSTLCLTVTR